MIENPDAIVLFSGGLDSLLAAKLLQSQQLSIVCLHFYSPFFGSSEKVDWWQKTYGLEIVPLDIGSKFISLLANGPEHGYGKHLNPCMDCKILQLSVAAEYMEKSGAAFLATGEVVGQRPMSQRRDALNRILNKTGLVGKVLRPLSAKLLNPTLAETSGLVKREKLCAISGRGRNPQLELARQFGITQIPSPAGGCRLTEKENSRRYWQILKELPIRGKSPEELVKDFSFVNLGRQFWRRSESGTYWLAIGRSAEDNKNLMDTAENSDLCIRFAHMAGPTGIARDGKNWPDSILREAAELTAGHSPKAKIMDSAVQMRIYGKGVSSFISVIPKPSSALWELPEWETVKQELYALRKSGKVAEKS